MDVEDAGGWYGEHGRLEGTEAATHVGLGGQSLSKLKERHRRARWDLRDTSEPDVQSTSMYFPRPQVVSFIVD